MTEPDFLGTTRASYDAVADDYTEWLRHELESKPLDRALLAGFTELVQADGSGPVADIGCGTGRVTAHLHGLGLPVFGIDLSPQMVAVARQAHPELRFDVGSMTVLDLPDGALGGIVAWYSIIHIPKERLPEVFAKFHRVLAPGGHVLLAFQVGDEPRHLTEAFGRAVSLTFHRLQPDRIVELLSQARLVPWARMLREPEGDLEKTQHAYLLARKPADGHHANHDA
ncbi:MAG: class I SAM-dependent methyltransferase [Pseudonocardiaceae bacterium]